jgi:hypothetical protein
MEVDASGKQDRRDVAFPEIRERLAAMRRFRVRQ